MAAPTTRPIGTRFRAPGNHWAAGYHTGVDFLNPIGDTLTAPVDSKIIYVGRYNGWGSAYGIHVIGEGKGTDGRTYRWIVAHLSKASVKKSQTVKLGAPLGKSGKTGNVTGPHCHFEVRRSGYGYWDHVNPQILLGVDAGPAEPDNDWFKVVLVNHGAASAALKKPGAKAKWLLRRKKLINEVLDVNADIIGGLECGSGSAWHYISTKYAQHGYVLVGGGKEGRHLWRKLATTQPAIESGAIDTPKSLRLDDDNKPSPYMIAKFNGSLGTVVLSHLEPRDLTGDTQVAQAQHVIATAEIRSTFNGVGRSRIVHLIDTASNNRVRELAFQAAGYGDVFDHATKVANKPIKSFNGYKPPVEGPRVDGIYTFVGDGPGKGDQHTRPVRAASQRLTTATDHHHQAAVIERQ